jgi:hypothetical protein
MRRGALVLAVVLPLLIVALPAAAEEGDYNGESTVETIPNAVRVTLVKSGDDYQVRNVRGGDSAERVGCSWSVSFGTDLSDTPYGAELGPPPDPEAVAALLLCDGLVVGPIWVAPDDVVDLDALARNEAQRYVEDVLVPAIGIGVNPAAQGLVGLRSWFWVEGFSGAVAAPPIAAFGVTIDVRMSTASVTWDFGDGTEERGDLGRAYPEESTVQHAHQHDGTFTVTAAIDLAPEYRIDGGPWLPLPNLSAAAAVLHPVEERQAVVSGV